MLLLVTQGPHSESHCFRVHISCSSLPGKGSWIAEAVFSFLRNIASSKQILKKRFIYHIQGVVHWARWCQGLAQLSRFAIRSGPSFFSEHLSFIPISASERNKNVLQQSVLLTLRSAPSLLWLPGHPKLYVHDLQDWQCQLSTPSFCGRVPPTLPFPFTF